VSLIHTLLLANKMRWIIAFGMVAAVLGPQNQDAVSREPTILQASSSRTLGVPDIAAYGNQCDGNGHVFYRLTPPNFSLNDSIVMKLEVKSETPTLYEQPTEYAGKIALIDYAVTPGGRVWYLDEMKDGGHTAVGFDSDGKATTHTHLDTPANLLVTRFAVSDDGSILVGGFFLKDAPTELQGKSYLAFFGRSGALAKDAGRDLPNQDLEAFAKGADVKQPVKPGIDGNFYVLDNNVILVMSESGEIVRRIKFQNPTGKGFVYDMTLSADLLSIEYLIPEKDIQRLRPEFLVLETATGATYGLYRPSEELGSICLCFSRRDGYLFSRPDNGKIKLLTAPLR
jgi:hypothetical protein